MFATVPDCQRHIIDLSGDGKENDGMTLPAARAQAVAARVTLNAIAIETGAAATGLTDYFRAQIITADGFVITAKGVADYPRAIHAKLTRELVDPTS